jgi:FkbM family methyltransferase
MTYILLDVGANHGQDSLNRTRDNNDVITYAFEPIPSLFEKIKSASVDFVNRYTLHNLALSDYDGESTFYIADSDPDGDWGASSLYPFVSHVGETWPGRKDLVTTKTITVKVSRFDTWYEANNHTFDHIDYFHCDTQGSDLRVLKGMGKYVSFIQEGVVECARNERSKLYAENHTVNEMKEFLQANGFEITSSAANDPWSNEVNLYFKKK